MDNVTFEDMTLLQKALSIIGFLLMLGVGAWIREKVYRDKYKRW